MYKFFVEENQIIENKIFLEDEDFNHICNVLRLKIGDELNISAKNEIEYICHIEKIENNQVILQIKESILNETEPKTKITLFQGLPKAEKMEFIIQKCIEIGVDEISPVYTERSIIKLSSKEEKKIARWNKIAEASAKQSKRGKIPSVSNVIKFKEALDKIEKFDLCIIPYENEKENTLKSIVKDFSGKSLAIFIGPEGGFSESEIQYAIEKGVIPITLGKRILRTETAGLFTIGIILYELEE